MTTDFIPHPPHTNYTATLKIRGTKEDFQNLYNLLTQAQPEDEAQHKLKEEVLDEIQELVNWIDTGEEYNGI
jgi:hypothetical protein